MGYSIIEDVKLVEWLEKRLYQLELDRKSNHERNKGLSGSIATEEGRIRDAYLTGKIELIKFILKRKYND